MRSFRLFHIFTSVVLAVCSPEFAVAQPALWEQRVDAVFAEYDGPDRPGVSLGILQGGELVYSRGYGLANLEYGVSNTPNTVFHVASVSKQFTCFAVHLLAEDGKLNVDDDVHQHLSWLPDFGETITLRQLMLHTSGLRDQWQLLAIAGFRLDDVITMDHLRKVLSRQQELNFPPGAEFLYCNSGYTLLAEVVAAVSGVSFKEFTRRRIFEPLGMAHTHFHDDHRHVVPNRAYSYAPDGDGFDKAVLSYANVGATSLFTTVEDLARWLANLDTGRVGGERVRAHMHEQGALKNGTPISYGSGLFHGSHRSTSLVSHGGADAGFRSFVGRLPEKGLGVVLLGNRSDLNAQGLALRVLDILLEQDVRATSDEDAFDPEVEAAKRVPLDTATLDAYTGSFLLNTGVVLHLYRDGDRLFRRLGRRSLELVPHSERKFIVLETGNRILLDAESEGYPQGLTVTLRRGGRTFRGQRIDDRAAATQREFAGRYYCPELETSYSILPRGDRLIARHARHPDIRLVPVSTSHSRGLTWFFRDIRFETDAEGRAIGFRLSGGRVRNLRFVRESRIRRF